MARSHGIVRSSRFLQTQAGDTKNPNSTFTFKIRQCQMQENISKQTKHWTLYAWSLNRRRSQHRRTGCYVSSLSIQSCLAISFSSVNIELTKIPYFAIILCKFTDSVAYFFVEVVGGTNNRKNQNASERP